MTVDENETTRTRIRVLIIGFGILLPYLARIPGAFSKGSIWFTSILGSGPEAIIFLGVFNAICWLSILKVVVRYRNPHSAWFPIILGFAFPAVAYGSVDLLSSSTASIALIFIPVYSLPFVFVGSLAGGYYDRKTDPKLKSNSNGVEFRTPGNP